jgi:hypothetical protein
VVDALAQNKGTKIRYKLEAEREGSRAGSRGNIQSGDGERGQEVRSWVMY